MNYHADWYRNIINKTSMFIRNDSNITTNTAWLDWKFGTTETSQTFTFSPSLLPHFFMNHEENSYIDGQCKVQSITHLTLPPHIFDMSLKQDRVTTSSQRMQVVTMQKFLYGLPYLFSFFYTFHFCWMSGACSLWRFIPNHGHSKQGWRHRPKTWEHRPRPGYSGLFSTLPCINLSQAASSEPRSSTLLT